MATNLRLRPELEAALRERSEREGRSQQDLIRDALELFLGLSTTGPRVDRVVLAPEDRPRPPRTPFRRAERLLTLEDGVSSLQLMDREDRL